MSATPATSDEGRKKAFATYVVPEIDVLLRVAHTLVPRPADAEDLVQDTLLRAYRGMYNFDGRHPRAWLLTIMRKTQVNRTRGRRPVLLDDHDAALDRLGDEQDRDAGPEAVVVGAAFDTVVAEGLDEFTYAEAAEVLGVPIGTVMSRLHRARVRLRDRLARRVWQGGERSEALDPPPRARTGGQLRRGRSGPAELPWMVRSTR